MKLFPFLTYAVTAAALPGHSSATWPYKNPLPGDSRSPCPGLNALANHGYLPHNGRGINGPMMVAAFSKAMNFDTVISQTAVDTNFAGIGVDTSVAVDLEDFFVSNITDFRCSVARDDYREPIDPPRIAYALTTAARGYVTPKTWGKTRVAVEALTTDPAPFGNDIAAGVGTGALMFLSTSEDSHANGNYSNVRAHKDWVAIFMGEERFPVELGWKPQAVSPSVDDLVGIQAAISDARAKALATNGH